MAGSVLVVGAGLAGLRTVEELRRAGFDGEITLAGAESHLPYDRPPLSKEVLAGKKTAGDIRLRDEDFFTDQDVRVRLGATAVGVDRSARQVSFADGTTLGYDHLVIATGITPRRLPFGADLAGVHVLRTIDDVLAFRQDIESASSAVIVGAGFIGCEAAAGLRAAGLNVVLVEPQPAPLAGALGPQIGELVGRLHTEAGVDLRCGVGVSELLGTDRVEGVRLSDGSEVAAEVVLVGIGSQPAVGWLDGSGFEMGDGILCDERGRTNDPHVWAVGDVAAWWRSGPDRHVRIEHWTGAGEQAAVAARDISGSEEAPPAGVPYFWSDQYGLKIQALGHFQPSDDVHVMEDDGRRFAAVYSRDGILTGAVGCGRPAKVMKLRPQLLRGAPLSEIDPAAVPGAV
jgi:3-phenylpropionate/trans-cinnamate dioxygenase ferredoxin reductase subunit